MKKLSTIIAILAVSFMVIGLSSCKKQEATVEDAAQQAEQTVDKVEKAGEAIKDVVNEVKK